MKAISNANIQTKAKAQRFLLSVTVVLNGKLGLASWEEGKEVER